MKQSIILLHGALGSKKQLEGLKQELSNDFEVHSINFEGHGGELTDKEFSIELFSNNLIDYINTHNLAEVVIFGYSMGGYVALMASLKAPGKIKKIITLGTKFDWELASAEKEIKHLNPEKIKEKIPHYAEKLKLEHQPANWELVMEKTASMMLKMGQGERLFDEDFRKINLDVILGVGELDQMVSFEETEYVSKLILNSKLIQLEGVKHPIDTIKLKILEEYIKSHL